MKNASKVFMIFCFICLMSITTFLIGYDKGMKESNKQEYSNGYTSGYNKGVLDQSKFCRKLILK